MASHRGNIPKGTEAWPPTFWKNRKFYEADGVFVSALIDPGPRPDLEDVQNHADHRQVAIEQVGVSVSDLCYPIITVLDPVTSLCRFGWYPDGLAKVRIDDGVTNATVNRLLKVVRAISGRAEREWEWLNRTPHVRMPLEPKRRVRWRTADEADRLLRELPEYLAEWPDAPSR